MWRYRKVPGDPLHDTFVAWFTHQTRDEGISKIKGFVKEGRIEEKEDISCSTSTEMMKVNSDEQGGESVLVFPFLFIKSLHVIYFTYNKSIHLLILPANRLKTKQRFLISSRDSDVRINRRIYITICTRTFRLFEWRLRRLNWKIWLYSCRLYRSTVTTASDW